MFSESSRRFSAWYSALVESLQILDQDPSGATYHDGSNFRSMTIAVLGIKLMVILYQQLLFSKAYGTRWTSLSLWTSCLLSNTKLCTLFVWLGTLHTNTRVRFWKDSYMCPVDVLVVVRSCYACAASPITTCSRVFVCFPNDELLQEYTRHSSSQRAAFIYSIST